MMWRALSWRYMNLKIEAQGFGAPLLLIHGWGMHGGMWGNAALQLSEHFRVLTVDLPGHGYSRGQPCRGQKENPVELLDEWVDSISAQFDEPISICGWSLGGQVALRWAMRYPQQINRLLLVASTPCFMRRPQWDCAMAADSLAEFAIALQQNYLTTVQRFLVLQVRGGLHEKEQLAALRRALFNRGEPDFDALQFGLEVLRDLDLRDMLPEISQHALVIAGARDMLTPPAASKYLSEKMPNARLEVIEGAAHAPFLSHHDLFVKLLVDFLHE